MWAWAEGSLALTSFPLKRSPTKLHYMIEKSFSIAAPIAWLILSRYRGLLIRDILYNKKAVLRLWREF